MVLKVSNEQCIFNTIKYKLRRKELDNLNYFSLKIRPEIKIANFLITILRIFCDSVIESL